ncbi:MAG: hypothetical protein LBG71_07935 [Clostridiales Family XIII bacterium]|jgi:hypothetical protein|nr:hypothetical protein [Clostridiales Family XIII bacterium]
MLKGTVIRIKDLTGAQMKSMYLIMTKYFDNIIESAFYDDLSRKEDAVLLCDENGIIHGFTSLAIFPQDESTQLIFSGDTIIEKEHWGKSDLHSIWLKNALAHAGKFNGKTYWLLLSKGIRTYKFLPTFFNEFYPHVDTDTPNEIQKIVDRFAREQFGDKYQNGVWVAGKDFLKEDFAVIREEQLKNKTVAFFLEKNPDYKRGNELVCITELSVDNLNRAGRKILGV